MLCVCVFLSVAVAFVVSYFLIGRGFFFLCYCLHRSERLRDDRQQQQRKISELGVSRVCVCLCAYVCLCDIYVELNAWILFICFVQRVIHGLEGGKAALGEKLRRSAKDVVSLKEKLKSAREELKKVRYKKAVRLIIHVYFIYSFGCLVMILVVVITFFFLFHCCYSLFLGSMHTSLRLSITTKGRKNNLILINSARNYLRYMCKDCVCCVCCVVLC
jgi:hypothetical protein